MTTNENRVVDSETSETSAYAKRPQKTDIGHCDKNEYEKSGEKNVDKKNRLIDTKNLKTSSCVEFHEESKNEKKSKIGQRDHTDLPVFGYNARDPNEEERIVSKYVYIGNARYDTYINDQRNDSTITSGIDMSLNVEDVFPYLEFTDSTCGLRHEKFMKDSGNKVGHSTQLTYSQEMTMGTELNADVDIRKDARGRSTDKFVVVQNQVGGNTKLLDFARLGIRACTLKEDIENLEFKRFEIKERNSTKDSEETKCDSKNYDS